LLTKKYKLLTKNTRQKEESNEVPYNENIFSCIKYDSEGNEKINSYAITLLMENGKLFSIIMESPATS